LSPRGGAANKAGRLGETPWQGEKKIAWEKSALELGVEFGGRGGYLWSMRRSFTWLSMLVLLGLALPAEGATGRVIKVLPFLLDAQGRHSLSPSLYERDAYQAELRQNPQKRSGMLYEVHWKAKGKVSSPLKLQLELRGMAEGNIPRQLVLAKAVASGGWFGHWTGLVLSEQQYKELGEVTAWRVSLWEGERLLGEQESFLWRP
jgi:hypothetical protein